MLVLGKASFYTIQNRKKVGIWYKKQFI